MTTRLRAPHSGDNPCALRREDRRHFRPARQTRVDRSTAPSSSSGSAATLGGWLSRLRGVADCALPSFPSGSITREAVRHEHERDDVESAHGLARRLLLLGVAAGERWRYHLNMDTRATIADLNGRLLLAIADQAWNAQVPGWTFRLGDVVGNPPPPDGVRSRLAKHLVELRRPARANPSRRVAEARDPGRRVGRDGQRRGLEPRPAPA